MKSILQERARLYCATSTVSPLPARPGSWHHQPSPACDQRQCECSCILLDLTVNKSVLQHPTETEGSLSHRLVPVENAMSYEASGAPAAMSAVGMDKQTAWAQFTSAEALSCISSHSSCGSESTVTAPPAPTFTPSSACTNSPRQQQHPTSPSTTTLHLLRI